MKKLISLCLALVLSLALAVPAAAAETGGVSVMVNGEAVVFPDGDPEISSGRTMVPMRAVLEALGAEVDYDHSTKTVRASLNGETVLIHVIGTDTITVGDGGTLTMDTVSYVSGGSTLVPLRFFSQVLGYEVYWDAGERTAVVIDKQGLIAEMDKAFTILNDLQAKQTPAAGNLSMEMDFSGSAKIMAPGMEMDLPFSIDLSGVYGENALNFSGKMDLSILALVLTAVPVNADGTGPSGEETTAALNQMAAMLKDLDFEMIYSDGSMWMKLPAVTDLLRAQGAEIPEGTVWMDLGGADMGEVYDLYDLSLSSAGGVTMGQVLYTMAELADAEMPTIIYEDAEEAAALLTTLMGDDTFTKDGDTYTWKVDQAMMDKLAAELGASSTDFPGTVEMTIKEDGSCTFKLDVTDEEFSMSMSGASTATDSTVEGKITVKDVCDVTFQGSAKVAPTENAPVTAPPAGETVIDLAGTPMPIAG